MFKKIITNQFTLIFVFVLLALFGVWWWGRQTGKRKVARNVDELPNSGSGIPSVGIDEKGNTISWDPTPLANEAHAILRFWSWTEDKNAWIDRMTALTNDQLVAVSNKFNTMYIGEGNGSLYDNVNETSFGFFDDRKAGLLARMGALNLHPAQSSDRKLFGIF